MRTYPDRVALLVLLGAWMLLAWPHLAEQFSRAEQAQAALASLSWQERAAQLDQTGFPTAEQIARAVPGTGCVVVLCYAGPEHLRYYRSRFAYYLYPRRVRFSDRTEEAAVCEYLAVFRDWPQNLAQEPFRGHWDERRLLERTAGMRQVLSGERLQIFTSRP